jgi:predicted metal-dependent hydrolase
MRATTRTSKDAMNAPTELPSTCESVRRLPIRRLLVDLSPGFPKLWNGGEAFRTHYLNALSMSFPVGEQFFIDAVKKGVAMLPAVQQAEWADEVRGFVGQEATHRFLHGQFNAELDRQGLKNHWQHWAAWRIQNGEHMHPVNHVAVTAAYEHFTAVMATGLLTHPNWLAGATPDLALMWRWHAVEESEHKTVAFDLYRAMGGSERRRILWFVYISVQFLFESTLQTLINLWHARQWWRPRTWWQAARYLFGPRGVWAASFVPLLKYLQPGFHPNQLGNAEEAALWLQAQRDAYAIVAGQAGG